MQCSPLSELPWASEFPGFESICVVLVMPVLREVDRQKGGQGRLAKRARTISSIIGQLIAKPSIQLSKEGSTPRVELITGDEFLPDPDLGSRLNYAQADDAIVGTASALAKHHAPDEVMLLSNDNGVLLAARRLDVWFHRAPDSWLMPAESDEEQKRLKKLEAEVDRLRSSEPVCVIRSENPSWHFKVKSFEPLSDEQIRTLMAAIQRQFPQETDFGPRESTTRNAAKGRGGLSAYFGQEKFVPATEEEILNYQGRYPHWLSACEDYLRQLHFKLEQDREPLVVAMELLNEGARPAEDVRVSFSMRGGDLLIQLPADEDDAETSAPASETDVGLALPPPPVAPKGFWKSVRHIDDTAVSRLFQKEMRNFARIVPSALNIPPAVLPLPPRDPDTFYWKSGTRPVAPRATTELTCKQWRHRAAHELFEFEVVWLDRSTSRKGALYVEIHAANLTDPVTKVFPIEVVAEQGDTRAEAMALVESLSLPNDLLSLPQR
ncbi:MAG: hypothetical protein DI562_02015 [Stenotrophomonas acidaminiphila]|nr:MAG: hypothetical protein DI562_02015 [Stenotrophomonas acidaminiphila]